MDRNISKQKRDYVLSSLEIIKEQLDDVNLKAKVNDVEAYVSENKYGLVFEKHSEEVFDKLSDYVPVFNIDDNRSLITDNNKPLNFILEGDNLHSLYMLNKTHKHSIDVIYIDPPYNTGATDWKYNNDYVDSNDGYRHSKWLSMMNERIRMAQKLLKNDGVLIVAIDENELATLKLLLEDIFGYDYKVDTICIVHNPRGVQGDNFSYTNEFALFVYKKGMKCIEDSEIENDEIDWRDLRDNGHESLRTDAATCFYAINVKDEQIIGFGPNMTQDLDFHPSRNVLNDDGSISIYPIDQQGIERKWRYSIDSVDRIKHLLRVKTASGGFVDIELGKDFGTYKTVWVDKKYDSNEYGTKLINNMVPNNDFDFPKSLYNTYECLYATIKNKPNATVLDFFAGSGTTGHAVLLLNKKLGGDRKFILCTNNDVGNKKEKEFKKMFPQCVNNKKIDTNSQEYKDFEEKYGIARSITYPRIVSAIKGYVASKPVSTVIYEKSITPKMLFTSNKIKKIQEEYENVISNSKNDFTNFKTEFEDGLLRVFAKNKKDEKVSGLGGNVLYYKTSFVNKFNEDDDLMTLFLNHTKELIMLRESKILSKKYIVLEDDELSGIIDNISSYKSKTLYISPYVLVSEDEKMLFENNDINIKRIPDVFYENELREVGEL